MLGNLLKNLGEENENRNISIMTLLRKKKLALSPLFVISLAVYQK